jgi:hypothetical protein
MVVLYGGCETWCTAMLPVLRLSSPAKGGTILSHRIIKTVRFNSKMGEISENELLLADEVSYRLLTAKMRRVMN